MIQCQSLPQFCLQDPTLGKRQERWTQKMNEKKEVEEGERSKAHQTPQGVAICTTGHTWTKEGKEGETGCETQALQWTILSSMLQKLQSLKCYRRHPRCLEGTENKSPSKHTWRKKMKQFHARIPLSSDSPVNWLHGERNWLSNLSRKRIYWEATEVSWWDARQVEDWLGKVPRDSEIPHSELKSLCRNGLGKPCPSAGSRMIELSPPTPPALDTEITTASRNVVASPELLGRIPLCPSYQVQVQGKYIQLVEPQPSGKGVRRSKYLSFVLLYLKKGSSSDQVSQAGLLLASTLLCANEENACLQLTKLERVFPFTRAYKPPSGLRGQSTPGF